MGWTLQAEKEPRGGPELDVALRHEVREAGTQSARGRRAGSEGHGEEPECALRKM